VVAVSLPYNMEKALATALDGVILGLQLGSK